MSHPIKLNPAIRTLLVATTALLSACATPDHSNTMIFGTSTRVALDVSQEPTGSLGATLGYKRQEAVWMPLLANTKTAEGKWNPTACTGDKCPMFVGTTGEQGGAAGANASDTYSVLATFSGDMGGSAQNAGVQAKVAQYFATGLAARLLAQYGGAAAVGASASAPDSATIRAANSVVATQHRQADVVSIKLSKTDGLVDPALRDSLLAKTPASELSDGEKTLIKSLKTRDELQDHLKNAPPGIAARLFSTLDKL
ncbi:hypothetical protein KAK06_21525 [Ideonella sp. 4Y11]|uniref:Lipoprotein n=1 Tax=Ideonella aquatica TaxID=2824119 RepID=A0A940YPA9_9BURK|nr:hypothetical protein [Ideonella aquatica]MBQ0961534.1 hypothetical protein [Ideonella aquatica]